VEACLTHVAVGQKWCQVQYNYMASVSTICVFKGERMQMSIVLANSTALFEEVVHRLAINIAKRDLQTTQMSCLCRSCGEL
jgi:hypothetical protein